MEAQGIQTELSYNNLFQGKMWQEIRLPLSVNGFSSAGHKVGASQEHLLLQRDDDHSDLLMFFGLMHLELHHKMHCNSSNFFLVSLNILFVFPNFSLIGSVGRLVHIEQICLLSTILSRHIEEGFLFFLESEQNHLYIFIKRIMIV